MIDNVKFWVREREILANHINSTHIIDLNAKYNVFTSEIQDCPLKGKYFNMEVILTCNGAFGNGSIHKLTNLRKGGQDQNYNDLCFLSANESILHLIKTLHIEGKTSLTNLEFGLNICTSKNPQEILNYNLLIYDFEPPNRNDPFKGKGDYREFHKTDYHIKVYNKGKQYGLKNHILRVEVKIISKRKLQSLGIFRLEDLLKESTMRTLYAFLVEELQKLMIVDDYTAVLMPSEDKNSLSEYTNPLYWKKLARDSSNKVRALRKVRFTTLISKYGLDNTKKEILQRVSEKFLEMMECPNAKLGLAA